MSWSEKLRHIWKQIRGVNKKISKRRKKGHKTPGLAEIRRKLLKKAEFLEAHPPGLDPDGDGLIVLDGKQIVEWIGKIALAAREAGAWHGVLLSGYRTPAYSESLCYGICGAPSCSGTCAGRASRHSERGDGRGAGDFTNPWELEAYCRKHNLPLHGNGTVLPNDHNHFSREGN